MVTPAMGDLLHVAKGFYITTSNGSITITITIIITIIIVLQGRF